MEISMAQELGTLDLSFEEILNRPTEITSEEYNEVMGRAGDLIKEAYEQWYERISVFQSLYMKKVLEGYVADNSIKSGVRELLSYLIDYSESGNSILNELTEEEAHAIEDQLWNDFGEMILDSEAYEEKDFRTGKSRGWCVDVMFGGNWCPWWDGWMDD